MAKKRRKLSKKKQAWADAHSEGIMRGAPLVYPKGVEKRFRIRVEKILAEVAAQAEREVIAIFTSETAEEFYTADESLAVKANRSLDLLFANLENMSRKRAENTSEAMVEEVNKSSARAIATSLKEISGSVTLKASKAIVGNLPEKLQAAIDVNVDLIVSISQQYLGKIKDAVNRSIMMGNGLADLTPFMMKQKGITERHARNVALDQTRKAYNSLNLERMKNVGITHYEWMHSGGGQAPRKFHIDRFPAGLNGGIYRVDDPPVIDIKTGEKGVPSQLINCKCRMRPVIVLDEEMRLAA